MFETIGRLLPFAAPQEDNVRRFGLDKRRVRVVLVPEVLRRRSPALRCIRGRKQSQEIAGTTLAELSCDRFENVSRGFERKNRV
jgi:hypothetical protein